MARGDKKRRKKKRNLKKKKKINLVSNFWIIVLNKRIWNGLMFVLEL